MDFATFAAITGLGLLDSLNPATLIVMAYFLAQSQPLARGAVFIGGTILVYLLCGVAILSGWMALTAFLSSLFTPNARAVLEIAAGLACIVGAAWMWRHPQAPTSKTAPLANGLWATAALAIGSTISDVPTALPYFAAVAELNAVPRTLLTIAGAIGWYNLLYVAPLLAMLAIRWRMGDRAKPALDRFNEAVRTLLRVALPPALALGGLYLAIKGSLHFA